MRNFYAILWVTVVLMSLVCCSDAVKIPAWSQPNQFHPAPVVEEPNGKVCNGGVYVVSRISHNDFHFFDLVTRQWFDFSFTTRNLTANVRHFSVVCCGNHLYTFGGFEANGPTVQLMNSFDTKTLVWKNLTDTMSGDVPLSRLEAGMTCSNDKVYLYCGRQCRTWGWCHGMDDLYEFDPATSKWTSLPTGICGRSYEMFEAVDSQLFVLGGRNWNPDGSGTSIYLTSSFWEFSLQLQTWRDMSAKLIPGVPYENGVSAVSDGKLSVMKQGLWEYNPRLELWVDLSSWALVPATLAVFGAHDGILYQFAGTSVGTDLYSLRLSDGAWTDLTGVVKGEQPPARNAFAFCAVGEGLFAFGGEVVLDVFGDRRLDNAVYAIEEEDSSWKVVQAQFGQAPSGRRVMGYACSGDSLFVFGCQTVRDSALAPLDDLYAFHVESRTWSELPQRGSVPGDRVCNNNCLSWHAGVLYLTSGLDWTPSLHAYDVASGDWSELAAFPGKAATIKPPSLTMCCGKLFLFGGNYGVSPAVCPDDRNRCPSPDFLNELHEFDTSSQTWCQIVAEEENAAWQPGSFNHAMACRFGHVYLFGGAKPSHTFTQEWWRFDIAEGTWLLLNPVLIGEGPYSRTSASLATSARGDIFLLGGQGSLYVTGTLNGMMDLHLLPPGPKDILFPSTAAQWASVTDWDRVRVHGTAHNQLDIELCTLVYPCAVQLVGDAGSRLVMAPTSGLRCDADQGCSHVRVSATDMECEGTRANAPLQVRGAAGLSIADSVVWGCASDTNGSAIRAIATASVELSNATFVACRSESSGGAVSCAGSSLRVLATSFLNCSARLHGGALHLTSLEWYPAPSIQASLTLASSAFRGCVAGSGCCVFVSEGAVSVETSSFQECAAQQDGGGLAVQRATAKVTQTKFFDNHAGQEGGGLHQAWGVLGV